MPRWIHCGRDYRKLFASIAMEELASRDRSFRRRRSDAHRLALFFLTSASPRVVRQRHPTIASASISTSIFGSISARTSTIDVAGRMDPNTSP